ncbi:hypothetical protein VTP01DRAFT_10743 [Rhizomucor pusillus]|uniref:uncharacterized protein n=1 Tax=Rhizomucor pusillus TaxID=4840 RepID=UPI003741F43E
MAKRFYSQAFTASEDETPRPHCESSATEKRTILTPRFRLNLSNRLASFRRHFMEPAYYDPYQREQVGKEAQSSSSSSSSDDEPCDPRPAKKRRSITSVILNRVVNGFWYGSAIAYDYLWAKRPDALPKPEMRGRGVDFDLFHKYHSPGWDERMQRAERQIRQLYMERQQNVFGMPVLAAAAFSLATEDDKNRWGLVSKDNLDVSFLPFPCAPPKPKRTYAARLGCYGRVTRSH